MKILGFRVENFRNIRLAECNSLSDFVVICGGNGCGKSALLEALVTAKEAIGSYGGFTPDRRAISSDANQAVIKLNLAFSKEEREFSSEKFFSPCPETYDVTVKINKEGPVNINPRIESVRLLLSYYSQENDSVGFFDFIHAERRVEKSRLQTWEPDLLSDQRAKATLGNQGYKFQLTKHYLAKLKVQELYEISDAYTEGRQSHCESPLDEIRRFFDLFFKPMKFKDVNLKKIPFEFVISTPSGDIDIDDLSSGEKEVLNIFIRFHQLKPKKAVILFDEADVHLHPDLGRRYLELLRELSSGNQLLLTTHSPEMMVAAGTDSLYTVLKQPLSIEGNQFVRVTNNEQMHNFLSDLMGSRGILSFNQRIVFIEGEYNSADREIYESLYPPSKCNLSFVPAGNSGTIRNISEKINELLTSSLDFQQYFSIIDGDIERFFPDPTHGKRLFRLPVYHVENFLLDDDAILRATKKMLSHKCVYGTAEGIEAVLKELVTKDPHLSAYAEALLDAKVAKLAKEAYESVFLGKGPAVLPARPKFDEVKEEALEILRLSIEDNTWRARCKGRNLLKAYCSTNKLKYEHFRNILIEEIQVCPDLHEIMTKIMSA